MGLLDDILSAGQNGGSSPFGVLYQSPLTDEDAKRKAAAADLLASMGISPSNAAPAQSPFPTPQVAAPAGAGQPVGFGGSEGILGVGPSSQPAAGPAPQPQGFGGGATPFGFAGPGSMTGISPAMMAPPQQAPVMPPVQPSAALPPPVANAQAAVPAAAAPAQNAPIAVGGYQMPRIGSGFPAPGDDDDEDESAKPAARPAAAVAAPGAAAPASPAPFSLGGSGVGDRLMKGTKGFLGNLQNGPIGAIAGGLGALITGNSTDPGSIAKERANVTAQALLAKGASPADVAAATNSPELQKALIDQYYGKDKFSVVKTKGDAFGGESFKVFNQADGTFKDVPAAEGGGAPSHAIDSGLKGDNYLKQFPPEVQSMVKDYIAGKSVPTGNPRRDNIVKQVASKYGEDMGTPVDDATYFARKQMRTQLSSSAPSSLGGQINIGNTAAGHLADLSQKALDLGNYDTGIAPLSAAVNGVRGLGTEQAAKMEALQGAAQHYGQEITKFYAGSPGGNAERDRFITSVNGARSPKELAAILATEGELMHSRLDALGGQIKGVLGEEGAAQYPVLRPDGQAGLAKVQENVAKLRGGGSAPAAAAPAKPATVTQNGHSYSLQPDGSYK